MSSSKTDAPRLIREARRSAGLTQQALAARMHTTQSAVAQLERPGSNPRVQTLERALRACGRRMVLEARPRRAGVDETLIWENLRLSAEQRLMAFEQSYDGLREIALAGARSRGELA